MNIAESALIREVERHDKSEMIYLLHGSHRGSRCTSGQLIGDHDQTKIYCQSQRLAIYSKIIYSIQVMKQPKVFRRSVKTKNGLQVNNPHGFIVHLRDPSLLRRRSWIERWTESVASETYSFRYMVFHYTLCVWQTFDHSSFKHVSFDDWKHDVSSFVQFYNRNTLWEYWGTFQQNWHKIIELYRYIHIYNYTCMYYFLRWSYVYTSICIRLIFQYILSSRHCWSAKLRGKTHQNSRLAGHYETSSCSVLRVHCCGLPPPCDCDNRV